MNKKNLKLIMELIFIFILPLLFICFTSEIQVEREFAYDNNGNYETSQETKNLSFDNSIIKYTNSPLYINYLDFNQLSNFKYNIVSNSGVRLIGYQNNTDLLNHKLYIMSNVDVWQIWISDETFNNEWGIPNEDAVNLGNTDNFITMSKKYIKMRNYPLDNYFDNYGEIEINTQVFDLTQMFGSGYEPSTIEELSNYIDLTTYHEQIESEIITFDSNNIISSNYKINYTIWGNIKHIVIDYLDVNDNILLDIVLCYTMLWIIMWIIWHLFYGLFELLWHIIPSPLERRL